MGARGRWFAHDFGGEMGTPGRWFTHDFRVVNWVWAVEKIFFPRIVPMAVVVFL